MTMTPDRPIAMTKDKLLLDLKLTVADLWGEALEGDEAARRWLLDAFPGHHGFLTRLWPEPQCTRPAAGLTREQIELLMRSAWNIESRLVIQRLANAVYSGD